MNGSTHSFHAHSWFSCNLCDPSFPLLSASKQHRDGHNKCPVPFRLWIMGVISCQFGITSFKACAPETRFHTSLGRDNWHDAYVEEFPLGSWQWPRLKENSYLAPAVCSCCSMDCSSLTRTILSFKTEGKASPPTNYGTRSPQVSRCVAFPGVENE